MEPEDQEQKEENPPLETSEGAGGLASGLPGAQAPGREAAPPDLALALQDKEKEVGALREQLLRLRADFDNLKRRSIREREEERLYASERVIRAILPVLDDLERAVEAAQGSDPPSLRQGVELILKALREALGREGLGVIPALHQPFDPSRHEAVLVVETEDHPEDLILQEIRKGYCLKDRVIRPARVAVAKRPRQGEEARSP